MSRVSVNEIEGASLITLHLAEDDRGAMLRAWPAEFVGAKNFVIAQVLVSLNRESGTLRGMHLQVDNVAETKFVLPIRGAIFDTIVDLRETSATFRNWAMAELTPSSATALVVPPGVAHGFITAANDTEVAYLLNQPYVPKSSRGVRWNDPAIGIKWPIEPKVISERDASWPMLGAQ